MSSLHRLEQQQKRFLIIHFQFAHFSLLLTYLKLKRVIRLYAPVVPSKPYPIQNQNGAKTIPVGAAHTYMAYIWGTARGFAQVMATSAQAASYSDVERSSKFVSVYRKHPFSPIFLPRAIRRISYGTKKTVGQWSRYFEVIHLTVGNTIGLSIPFAC